MLSEPEDIDVADVKHDLEKVNERPHHLSCIFKTSLTS